jgi:hypothetical protein
MKSYLALRMFTLVTQMSMIPLYEQLKGGMLGYLRGLQPTQPAMTNMTQAATYWNKGRWDGFWEQ